VSEKSVLRGFAQLATGDAAARIIAFCASIVVARRLDPALYGVLGFANAVILYFRHMAQCGIDLLGVRSVAEDESRVRTLAPSILGVRTLIALALCLLLAGGALLALPHPDGEVLALLALTLLAIGPDTRWIHLGLQNALPVAAARALGELLFLGLVFFGVHSSGHLARVPLAQVAGDLLSCGILFYWLRSRGFAVGLRFDWRAVRPVFARAFPLVLNVLLGLMIYNSDLVLLYALRGAREAGYYTAAYQLISFLINMSLAYSISLLPALTRVAADTSKRNRLYEQSISNVFALGLPVAVGGAFVATNLLVLVFSDRYAPAGPPMAILLWTIPLMLVREVGVIGLLVCAREKTILNVSAVAVPVNLVLNLVLIPPFGTAGAASATLATECARLALTMRALRDSAYTPPPLSRLARSALAAACMGIGLWLAPSLGAVPTILLGALIYGAALLCLGGFRQAPRDATASS
jgi:O-antigen/teichoic acid export membrane protein